jgi:hypothetical protein
MRLNEHAPTFRKGRRARARGWRSVRADNGVCPHPESWILPCRCLRSQQIEVRGQQRRQLARIRPGRDRADLQAPVRRRTRTPGEVPVNPGHESRPHPIGGRNRKSHVRRDRRRTSRVACDFSRRPIVPRLPERVLRPSAPDLDIVRKTDLLRRMVTRIRETTIFRDASNVSATTTECRTTRSQAGRVREQGWIAMCPRGPREGRNDELLS